MKDDWIKEFDIPNMENFNLPDNEREKAKDLFKKIAILLRDECGKFEIHIGYHVICELKKNILYAMVLNLKNINEELERRKENNE